ncbi:MAG TPA: helix-turn-helix domain-containing protein [Candidatus Limnocylindrales bacterium]|nr:helix-turn-helix domain-containing protein [Candidatus Limnocylindrales bacterium]
MRVVSHTSDNERASASRPEPAARSLGRVGGAPSRSNSTPSEPPLSLGPASRLLGVDPDTLRRWADEGRIDVFTTAGGHRRFARSTLERILQARRRDATVRLASLGATTDRLSRAYRRGYSDDTAVGDVRNAVPAADREAFRDDGRALVAALLAHLDATDDPGRDAAEEDALAATDQLARRVAGAGISLGDAVSLFVAARRPFLGELGAIARRRSLDPDRLSAIYDASSSLLDRLLLRLVATHQEVRP